MTRAWGFVGVLVLGAVLAAQAPIPTANHTVAFVGVSLVPMDAPEVRPNQTVVVDRGIITAVGDAATVDVPPGALVVDGRGRYLMPGLVDFHVHLRDTRELAEYLAHGVTTVVHLSGPTGGVEDVLALQRDVAIGRVLGPSILASGRILDGDPPIFGGVSRVVTTEDDARAAVREQRAQGVDFFKVYNNLSPALLRAAAREANQHQMAIVGHVPRLGGREDALGRALDAGLRIIAHAEEIFFTAFYGDTEARLDRGLPPAPDLSRIPEVVQRIRNADASVIANLSFVAAMTRAVETDGASVLDDPAFARLPEPVARMWRAEGPWTRRDLARLKLRQPAMHAFLRDHLVPALHAGGVQILAGTDASAPGLHPGRSLHLELDELVAAGLSPYDALQTATVNAASVIRQHVPHAPRLGIGIQPATVANLLLLEANPLEDIRAVRRIAGVMVRGRWLPR